MTKKLSSQFAHKYIVECVKYAGGAKKFSEIHDISLGHVEAVIHHQRKLKPGPRMMAAVGMREVAPRVYVIGKDRK